MLLFTRESFLSLLLEGSEAARLYRQGGDDLPRAVLLWLERGEELAARLRLPLAAQLAGKRMRLMAAIDGMDIGMSGSRSRARRHAAVAIYGEAEEAIRAIVASHDERILSYRDKLAQLLAVASAAEPFEAQGTRTPEQWAAAIWADMKPLPETRNMMAWLAASLSRGDLLALLAELLLSLSRSMNGNAQPQTPPANSAPTSPSS